jgi:hypothetical protein
MVQPNPDAAPALLVRKRDGRSVPFDGTRVATSLGRALASAGQQDPLLARDLAAVVLTYLRGHSGEGVVAAAEIAHLVHEVLLGASCTAAAAAFRLEQEQRERARHRLRIRTVERDDGVRGIPRAGNGHGDGDPEEWSKGRVISLLAREAGLSEPLAQEVAADVERGLFASGLRSVSAALLREWVDNELLLRGLPARLGRHQFVGLASHELRDVLGAPAAGLAAEHELGARLLERYALREVVAPDVAAAHEAGLLDLENLRGGARLDTVALAPGALPVLAPAGRAAPPRELPLLLRQLGHLASREVLLAWDGPEADAASAADFLAQLVEPVGLRAAGARLVLCLPSTRRACVEAFLDALEELRRGPAARQGAALPGLRLHVEGLDDELLLRATGLEVADARVSFTAVAVEPRLITGSVALNVARIALSCGPRAVPAFLEALERAVELGLSALAAQEALLPAGGARAALRAVTGLPETALPASRRLALCGLPEAASVLLGEAPRARANRLDLAAAIGERIAQVLERQAPGLPVRLGRAGAPACERFGRLDLAAFADARDRLPLAGHREAFRYDGAVLLSAGDDAGAAGEHAARAAQLLGLSPDAPAPRCTGSAAQRADFLRAFARTFALQRDAAPCA